MTPCSPLEARVEALLKDITSGQWFAPGFGDVIYQLPSGACVPLADCGLSQSDAEFIAEAPQPVRDLVDEVTRLHEENEKLSNAVMTSERLRLEDGWELTIDNTTWVHDMSHRAAKKEQS